MKNCCSRDKILWFFHIHVYFYEKYETLPGSQYWFEGHGVNNLKIYTIKDCIINTCTTDYIIVGLHENNLQRLYPKYFNVERLGASELVQG